MIMKRVIVFSLVAMAFTTNLVAQKTKTVMVGGAAMYPNKTLYRTLLILKIILHLLPQLSSRTCGCAPDRRTFYSVCSYE
jgi:hypothetical protein